jgi:hypothetical protein
MVRITGHSIPAVPLRIGDNQVRQLGAWFSPASFETTDAARRSLVPVQTRHVDREVPNFLLKLTRDNGEVSHVPEGYTSPPWGWGNFRGHSCLPQAGRFGSAAFAIGRPAASTGTSRATAVRRTSYTDSPHPVLLDVPTARR